MELPALVLPRPIDFSGIGNALDDRYKFQLEQARANHLARQDDIALQNEMLKLKAARTAEANTAASKAAVKSALSNSVVGLPGEAAGPYMPSVQRATNALALQGRTTEANTLSNFLEQQAKQDTQRNLANKAAGEVDELTLKNEASMSAQAKDAIDMVTSPDQLREMVVRLHAPDSKLASFFERNGITADRAIAEYDRMVASGMPFEQIRQMMSMGAAKTATHLADLAQKEAQTYQANAAGNKSMGELDIAQGRAPVDIAQIQSQTRQNDAAAAKATGDLELAQQKQTWEQRHPGYELKETAQGWVAINKNNPNDVTLIKLGNEPAMPKPSGLISDLAKLIQEQAALPDGSPLRQQYADAIAKLTGGVTPGKTEDAILATEDAVGQIDKLLKHPGFSEAVGASFGTSYIPGTDAQGAIALHDQVTGTAFLNAYNSLRGTGSITEIEGQKATAAKARMNRNTSEKDYIEAATEFKNILLRGVEREKARLKTGGTSPAPDATAKTETAPNTNSKGWVLHTDAKGNKAYVSPDGKQFEEVK